MQQAIAYCRERQNALKANYSIHQPDDGRIIMLHVLIDDAKEGTGYDLVARTSAAALFLLEALQGRQFVLYIDFDLGSGSINGNQVIKQGLEKKWIPNKVNIVSWNPGGKKLIAGTLKDAGYKATSGSTMEKV